MHRNNKLFYIFPLLLSVLFLSGCGEEKRPEGYCFAALFSRDEDSGRANVTLFCKTGKETDSSSSSEESEKEEGESEEGGVSVIRFSGNTLEEALRSTADSDYEIYFKSTKALVFSSALPDAEVFRTLLFLLDHTRFQSRTKIYAVKDENEEVLYEKCRLIAENGRIAKSEEADYVPLARFLRESADALSSEKSGGTAE